MVTVAIRAGLNCYVTAPVAVMVAVIVLVLTYLFTAAVFANVVEILVTVAKLHAVLSAAKITKLARRAGLFTTEVIKAINISGARYFGFFGEENVPFVFN